MSRTKQGSGKSTGTTAMPREPNACVLWQDPETGRTQLHNDAASGNEVMVKAWMDQGADTALEDNVGWTALDLALLNNHLEVVKILHISYSRRMNNVFFAACISGRFRAVKEMINRGQLVDELFTERCHGDDQWTVLFKICYEYLGPDCIAIARLLIENGANVNFTNSKMWTPLLAACKNSEIAMAHLLIENGADVNAANGNKQTPFWHACFTANLPLARLLIDPGAIIHINFHLINYGASGISALECIRDPVDRVALELYATPREKNWRRRKSFAFFFQSLKVWAPTSKTQWALQQVLELSELQRLIGSFL